MPTRHPTLLIAATLLLSSTALTGCSTNSATGKRQLNLLSRSQEISIGSNAMAQLTTGYGGEVPSAGAREYVTEVGMSLVTHIEPEYQDLPWEFTFLNTSTINAFALPGGKVFLTRGLAERMSTEAELAGVLGHEIGHVTARHANSQISNQLLITGAAIGISVVASESDNDLVSDGVPILVGASTGLFLLKFSRDDEHESDRLGMRYMTRAGYNPNGMVGVMETLQEASGSNGSGIQQFMSTHPLPSSRIERAHDRIRIDYTDFLDARTGTSDYERRMLTPLSKLPPAPEPEPAPAEG
ncbi:MAG: M48 family metalloprotease [Planctomycetota bacterium]|jgi:predicted Zn-dependent protease